MLRSKENFRTLRSTKLGRRKRLLGFFLLSLVFIACACTSGPPKIAAVHVGIEVSFDTTSKKETISHFIILEAEDPDGLTDLVDVRIEAVNDSLFWHINQNSIQRTQENKNAFLTIRNLRLAELIEDSQIRIRLFDRAGNEDEVNTILPKIKKDGSYSSSKLSLSRTNTTYTIIADTVVLLTQTGPDGSILLQKSISAGTYQWTDWGRKIDTADQLYLQTASGGTVPIIRRSGPW